MLPIFVDKVAKIPTFPVVCIIFIDKDFQGYVSRELSEMRLLAAVECWLKCLFSNVNESPERLH